MIKSLIIDVDGKYANYIAIHDDKIIRIMSREINKNLTSYFIETLKWFTYASNTELKDLNNLYFVNGPGSFTNIRLSTLVVKTLWTLYPNIKLKEIDRFHYHADYKKDEFLYLISSSTSKFVYIHSLKEDIVESKLVSNEEFDNLVKIYHNFELKELEESALDSESIQKYKLSDFNLSFFNDVNSIDDLSANYSKEPNIDKKVIK